MFRYSCGKCHYTNTKRPSDITIADFWGWEKIDKNINKDDKGVSLILVNSEKGRKIFNLVKNNMIVVSVQLQDCMQPNLRRPSVIHPLRKNFERDFIRKGIEYVMNHDYNQGFKYSLINNYRKTVININIYKQKILNLLNF